MTSAIKLKVAAGVVAGAVFSGGLAFAAIPEEDGTITACYAKAQGSMRVVDSASQCRSNENVLTWNQQGPEGPPGLQGEPGPQGAKGDAGAPGAGGIGSIDELAGKPCNLGKPGEGVASVSIDPSNYEITLACPPSNPAAAVVMAVKGDAFGYFGNFSLFGGPFNLRGPAPTVTLPPGGSAVPVTASSPTGIVQYGQAILFSSGPITVSTQGTTGPTGSVTSTSDIQTVNTSDHELFTADRISSTCTASETGVTGSTTVLNGTVILQDPDPSETGEAGEEIVTVPTNPEPNTNYFGKIASTTDEFRYVFNEQIMNPDGSITVNAVHQYLFGPAAVGDLIIGQVICGVTSDGTPPTTTSTTGVPSTTTTTSTPATPDPPTRTIEDRFSTTEEVEIEFRDGMGGAMPRPSVAASATQSLFAAKPPAGTGRRTSGQAADR